MEIGMWDIWLTIASTSVYMEILSLFDEAETLFRNRVEGHGISA